MKRILPLALLVCLLTGCHTPEPAFTLNPGERVILATPERATLFRATFETDYGRTGRVVEVERKLGVDR